MWTVSKLRFTLTAESHHLSSFQAWRSVSLAKRLVKSVVLVGESATPRRKVSSGSFLSGRLVRSRCRHTEIKAEASYRVPSACDAGRLLCVIPGMFFIQDELHTAVQLSLHSGTGAADVSSPHPAAGAAVCALPCPTKTASRLIKYDEAGPENRHICTLCVFIVPNWSSVY